MFDKNRFFKGMLIGALVALPTTVGAGLAWTWVTAHLFVLWAISSIFWVLLFVGLWLWARRRPVAEPGLGSSVAGFIVGCVVMPFVASLVLASLTALVRSWQLAWAILATLVAIVQTVRLRRRVGTDTNGERRVRRLPRLRLVRVPSGPPPPPSP